MHYRGRMNHMNSFRITLCVAWETKTWENRYVVVKAEGAEDAGRTALDKFWAELEAQMRDDPDIVHVWVQEVAEIDEEEQTEEEQTYLSLS